MSRKKINIKPTGDARKGLSAKHRSSGRTRLFKWISILLPFALLFVIELCLRLFGYGNDLHLFIEDPADKSYFIMNPAASKKYFTNQANATTGNIEPFKKEKEAGTMRIFILGESTTIGYPYFHNGSFHRWLQYRLMHDYPDRNFELINVALTAVNSYTVLGFAREVVDYQPDAVLIYTGHNEYYGALGVGSTDNIGGNRYIVDALLSLRKLRLVQWITNTYEHVVSMFRSHKAAGLRTRMEVMVADEQIPYGSKLYQRGIEQFRDNMRETLQLLDSRHIPVFVSNLVSNEKDLMPFISVPADSVHYRSFSGIFSQGKSAYEAGDWAGASRYLKEAEVADSMYAQCNYYLGRLSLRQGDPGQAKAWFSRAEELDALRFRAPAVINYIIPDLAAQYKSVHLVDTRSAFEARSEYGIIGNDLLLEHVHPNIHGYALLSDAFYRAMKAAGMFASNTVDGRVVPGPSGEMGLDKLLATMPVLEMDSLTGAFKIGKLKRSWPFNQGATDSARGTDSMSLQGKLAYGIVFGQLKWEEAMDTLYSYYSGIKDWAHAVKVVEALVLEHPMEAELYDRTANIYGQLGDDENAAFYFQRSFTLAPTFDKARSIFVLYLKRDRPAEALPFLDYAIRNNASGMNLSPVKQYTQKIIQLQQTAKKEGVTPSLLNNIAAAYSTMGNKQGAAIYIDSVLRIDPGNKDALLLRKSFE
jgi:tetratricopeptide (TPR) repeat protein